MIPLLLIRHGKTDWNIKKKLQGQRDISLSPAGRTLLEKYKLPAEFASYQWRSSPLIRAQETAHILGAKQVQTEDRLIEMNWGKWEGHTVAELRALYGKSMLDNEARGLHMCPPDGESPADVQTRLLPFLKSLQKPTIAVTHKGVIRAIKSLAYSWDMTDKSPVAFDWGAAHLFLIDKAGMPHAERVNIKLEMS